MDVTILDAAVAVGIVALAYAAVVASPLLRDLIADVADMLRGRRPEPDDAVLDLVCHHEAAGVYRRRGGRLLCPDCVDRYDEIFASA